MTHTAKYFSEVQELVKALDFQAVEMLVDELDSLRQRNGRLFILGVGGSAANASHAVNDFRKICGIEAYTPTDNVAELTARTNDDGWHTVFSSWLAVSKAKSEDAILVLSVGGGNAELNVSPNIIHGLNEAKQRNLKIFGIVGRDGGYTKQIGDHVIVIPTISSGHVTPHVEAFQAVIWHCLVSHPKLQVNSTKW